jgi:hypothetical protein
VGDERSLVVDGLRVVSVVGAWDVLGGPEDAPFVLMLVEVACSEELLEGAGDWEDAADEGLVRKELVVVDCALEEGLKPEDAPFGLMLDTVEIPVGASDWEGEDAGAEGIVVEEPSAEKLYVPAIEEEGKYGVVLLGNWELDPGASAAIVKGLELKIWPDASSSRSSYGPPASLKDGVQSTDEPVEE